MDEIWKDIPEYEGLYQVSNLGRVKSLPKYNQYIEKIMKFTTRSGYHNLILRKNGERKSKQVHRLVAEAFIPKTEGKDIVNHKDFNRKNNNVNNLEWVTQKENINWSSCNMRHIKINTKTNTGYHHITKRKNGIYRVVIKGKEKSFKFIKEAIKYRNEVINEIDNK